MQILKICWRNMKIPTLAIIDDGINPYYIPQDILCKHLEISNNAIKISKQPPAVLTHGTACYQMFCRYVKTPYQLVSIKATSSITGTGSKDAILTGLNFCDDNNIDLIHMSLGTRKYLDFASIAGAVLKLKQSIIVAACSNQNVFTLPACLPNVIGVRHCDIKKLEGNFTYITRPFDNVDIMTYVKNSSNSTAAPLITAHVCKYIAEGYQAVALSTVHVTKVEDFIFSLDVQIEKHNNELSLADMIMLYYNFTLPDILFLHLDQQQTASLPKKFKPDIVIDDNMLKMHVSDLLETIKGMLS